jgi:nucleotide-binding universal stress UspA family protein
MMSNVIACIDNSPSAPAVCDYAAWATLRLQAQLLFLHVLDQHRYPVSPDLSGSIGLGSREHLLDELASLDQQRGKLALEQGAILLAAAKQRALATGAVNAEVRQRHGDLVASLREMEADIRLLVIGKQGDTSTTHGGLVGSQLESVIRTLHRPILVTPSSFTAPRSALLAFDGSATMRKAVEMLATSPLFHGMPIHIVAVTADAPTAQASMQWAQRQLEQAGHSVTAAVLSGDVEAVLHAYQAEHALDVLVMGAYGHSRIRQFLVGSTTTGMLRTSTTPLLLLR